MSIYRCSTCEGEFDNDEVECYASECFEADGLICESCYDKELEALEE